jgi:hypothetical protein
MNDEELEKALRSVGERIDWPDAPDVTAEVVSEIRRREAHPVPLPRTGPRRWGRGLLIAAALLIPVAGTAIAATLVWNLGGITVQVVPPTSTPLPSDTLSPDTLGRLIALEDAPAEVGFVPIIPKSLGAPDQVYAGVVPRTYVVLAWSPSKLLPRIPDTPWGAVLFEVPGADPFISKDLFVGQAMPVVVDGREAVWARGEHPIELVEPGEHGRFLVTGNVLLWSEQEYAMRLESLLARADALRIAEEIVIPSRLGTQSAGSA